MEGSKIMFKMQGVVPPMITPFTKEGDIDVVSLKKLSDFLSINVNGLFINGSYGSGALMNLEERKKVAEIVIETVAGRIPVIVHVGTTTNRDSCILSQHAESIGANAVAAVGPFYYTHSEHDVEGFYTDLINSTKLPVYLYNNPGFQGYNIDIKMLQGLKEKGLAGTKDATFDIIKHANYQRLLQDESFDVALGTEAMFASACVLGAKAFIPGLGNAFPEILQKMYQQGMDGDIKEMCQTQFTVNRMREIMYIAKSTQLAIYAMLEIRDIIKAYPRKPFTPASEKEIKEIKSELLNLGVL